MANELHVGVVTLFPEMLSAITEYGVTRRAVKEGLLSVDAWNPRDYTTDKHRTVDDRPYGGGPGMLMMVEPLRAAIADAKQAIQESSGTKPKVIYLSPQGRRLDQKGVVGLSQTRSLVLVAGRYEGIDERVIESDIDEEWSIGDFVLSGGELPAMVLIDALARQVPGVLGHNDSAQEDSFANGLLDFPQYTRPEVLDGKSVPAVLLSGHHEEINRWRLTQSLKRTWERRPDLINDLALTDEQRDILAKIVDQEER
ncbi:MULTISPECIES: tRNA (guanosine(37)-N1)-methyltransferase TrmD [Gammaproteobacteria]|uniref:tRNA (guanosine(37)-N1)-methyltransferase TrmD n=1 Tax=Gammaproteobacteria TaxID=1236 RepID=UPI000DD05190|nr:MULTISPECIES: tRNA (guanosine(37)-N1)-methyltransferase TrmD [Gammaproteobacteria]RTE87548.1 tRNA (guanosine(37)-N1)-methyltransferase TrmD [Aliidiomarina sp. B3213]TCZ92667.1 tRNA (guanosine(37)-N1)-methyltransferase TrmD [Lysobacter sp. N42]